MYRPERALGNGKTGAEEELGDLSDEALGVLGAVVLEDVLGDGRIADDDEVAGSGGKAVDGAVLLHPLEEGEEEGAAEEVGDVIELRVGDGDAGGGGGAGAGEGGEPVGAHPRPVRGFAAIVLVLVVVVVERGRGSEGEWDPAWGLVWFRFGIWRGKGREKGGGDGRGEHDWWSSLCFEDEAPFFGLPVAR